MANKIEVGDTAPDFNLSNQHGDHIRLSDFIGKKAVVLYFYPKDDTPGCTAQACTFRDRYQEFQDHGAEVIGVSKDGINSHKKFAHEYSLPFSILSDHKGELKEKYGVRNKMGLFPGRVTYIIDKEGVVRYVFNSLMSPKKHIDRSIEIIRKL